MFTIGNILSGKEERHKKTLAIAKLLSEADEELERDLEEIRKKKEQGMSKKEILKFIHK